MKFMISLHHVEVPPKEGTRALGPISDTVLWKCIKSIPCLYRNWMQYGVMESPLQDTMEFLDMVCTSKIKCFINGSVGIQV